MHKKLFYSQDRGNILDKLSSDNSERRMQKALHQIRYLQLHIFFLNCIIPLNKRVNTVTIKLVGVLLIFSIISEKTHTLSHTSERCLKLNCQGNKFRWRLVLETQVQEPEHTLGSLGFLPKVGI